jgi:hypothetical protein
MINSKFDREQPTRVESYVVFDSRDGRVVTYMISLAKPRLNQPC